MKRSKTLDSLTLGLVTSMAATILTCGIKEKLTEIIDDIPITNVCSLRQFSPNPTFKYNSELPQIQKHSQRINIEPELLMAIRMAEGARDNLAYGILPQGQLSERYNNDKGYTINNIFHEYQNEKEKQLCWAAWTIKKNQKRFQTDPQNHEDFISYLADRYCPINADNDPTNLNQNWEKNVRFYFNKFKKYHPQ